MDEHDITVTVAQGDCYMFFCNKCYNLWSIEKHDILGSLPIERVKELIRGYNTNALLWNYDLNKLLKCTISDDDYKMRELLS